MNPFEKLKQTIQRVGLEYLSENPTQTDLPKNQQNLPPAENLIVSRRQLNNSDEDQKDDRRQQEDQRQVRWEKLQFQLFKGTQPLRNSNKARLYNHSYELQIEEMQRLHETSQQSYVGQIKRLRQELSSREQTCSLQKNFLLQLESEVRSLQRQNQQLRAHIIEKEEKNKDRVSESTHLDATRRLKQEIDRVNSTVRFLDQQLNQEKRESKRLCNQLGVTKGELEKCQQELRQLKSIHQTQLQQLNQQLIKRAHLLQHSIKTSRDEALTLKNQLKTLKGASEQSIAEKVQQIRKLEQQINQLNNSLLSKNYLIEKAETENQFLKKEFQTLQLSAAEKSQTLQKILKRKAELEEKIVEKQLIITHLEQRLHQERNNSKIQVVELRDQGLQMQLQLYKQKYRELLKQKVIWQALKDQCRERELKTGSLNQAARQQIRERCVEKVVMKTTTQAKRQCQKGEDI